MADVWVLLLIVAFFGVCVALVRGCEVIVGPDEPGETGAPSESEPRDAEPVGAAR